MKGFVRRQLVTLGREACLGSNRLPGPTGRNTVYRSNVGESLRQDDQRAQ